ncbi:hypothetical protein M3Y99_00992700 [Aphelenchoides fujianensis]|nr:hypothetical protein M3Y99_00992700 [Aphelenchoides fujianensis]
MLEGAPSAKVAADPIAPLVSPPPTPPASFPPGLGHLRRIVPSGLSASLGGDSICEHILLLPCTRFGKLRGANHVVLNGCPDIQSTIRTRHALIRARLDRSRTRVEFYELEACKKARVQVNKCDLVGSVRLCYGDYVAFGSELEFGHLCFLFRFEPADAAFDYPVIRENLRLKLPKMHSLILMERSLKYKTGDVNRLLKEELELLEANALLQAAPAAATSPMALPNGQAGGIVTVGKTKDGRLLHCQPPASPFAPAAPAASDWANRVPVDIVQQMAAEVQRRQANAFNLQSPYAHLFHNPYAAQMNLPPPPSLFAAPPFGQPTDFKGDELRNLLPCATPADLYKGAQQPGAVQYSPAEILTYCLQQALMNGLYGPQKTIPQPGRMTMNPEFNQLCSLLQFLSRSGGVAPNIPPVTSTQLPTVGPSGFVSAAPIGSTLFGGPARPHSAHSTPGASIFPPRPASSGGASSKCVNVGSSRSSVIVETPQPAAPPPAPTDREEVEEEASAERSGEEKTDECAPQPEDSSASSSAGAAGAAKEAVEILNALSRAEAAAKETPNPAAPFAASTAAKKPPTAKELRRQAAAVATRRRLLKSVAAFSTAHLITQRSRQRHPLGVHLAANRKRLLVADEPNDEDPTESPSFDLVHRSTDWSVHPECPAKRQLQVEQTEASDPPVFLPMTEANEPAEQQLFASLLLDFRPVDATASQSASSSARPAAVLPQPVQSNRFTRAAPTAAEQLAYLEAERLVPRIPEMSRQMAAKYRALARTELNATPLDRLVRQRFEVHERQQALLKRQEEAERKRELRAKKHPAGKRRVGKRSSCLPSAGSHEPQPSPKVRKAAKKTSGAKNPPVGVVNFFPTSSTSAHGFSASSSGIPNVHALAKDANFDSFLTDDANDPFSFDEEDPFRTDGNKKPDDFVMPAFYLDSTRAAAISANAALQRESQQRARKQTQADKRRSSTASTPKSAPKRDRPPAEPKSREFAKQKSKSLDEAEAATVGGIKRPRTSSSSVGRKAAKKPRKSSNPVEPPPASTTTAAGATGVMADNDEPCAHPKCSLNKVILTAGTNAIEWIACDDCSEWYHAVCVFNVNRPASKKEKFKCRQCQND